MVASPFPPLQPSKTPETPNLSKICPSDCFGGFQSGGLKFGKTCQKFEKNGNFRTNFDKFFQISVPLTGTPQNNRWDKFWTNLGFRAFLKAVRGKRVRKPMDFWTPPRFLRKSSAIAARSRQLCTQLWTATAFTNCSYSTSSPVAARLGTPNFPKRSFGHGQ